MAIITEYSIELLAELGRRGIEMRADGDRLQFRPAAALTPDLSARVKEHKPALLAILADDPGEIVPDDLPHKWREMYEERAAIRHFDGGQALEHAEAEALRETLAAMRRLAEQERNGHSDDGIGIGIQGGRE